MLKNLLDKGKCVLGFHDGPWQTMQGDTCLQQQTCTRCQVVSHRTEHQWEAWHYQADAACEVSRTCARCAETEQRVEHHWADPVYSGSDSCEQAHICQRCGQEKPAGVNHQWNRWDYVAADHCTQVQRCGRCNQTGPGQRLAHDWGPWQASDFYQATLRVCHHCGALVFDLGAEGDDGPSLQAVEQAVTHVVAADTLDTLYTRIIQHQQTLFSPVVEQYARFSADQYSRETDYLKQLEELQGLLERCRREGIDTVFHQLSGTQPDPTMRPTAASPPPQEQGTRAVDQRLVGRYRLTDSTYSDGFSSATDTHMHLGGDGRFSWSSETAGSFGNRRTGPIYGRWTVENGHLCLLFDDGSRYTERFELSADSLFLPNQGHYRLWKRY